MMTGGELRLLLDILTGQRPDEEMTEIAREFVEEMQDWVEETHHQVRGNLVSVGGYEEAVRLEIFPE